jgi:hypothetical protein
MSAFIVKRSMALQWLLLVPVRQVPFFTVFTKCKPSLHLCVRLVYSLLFGTLSRSLVLASPEFSADNYQSVKRWADF